MKPVIFPGSFDPVTNGHVHLIFRARAIFGAVRILVCHNAGKKAQFSVEQRVALLQEVFKNEKNITIDHTDGPLADYLQQQGLHTVVRGLRSAHDWNHERTNAWFNKQFNPSMETVFLPADEKYQFISSSSVKEACAYGADISAWVPPCVVRALQQK